jgi:hypothetical protein
MSKHSRIHRQQGNQISLLLKVSKVGYNLGTLIRQQSLSRITDVLKLNSSTKRFWNDSGHLQFSFRSILQGPRVSTRCHHHSARTRTHTRTYLAHPAQYNTLMELRASPVTWASLNIITAAQCVQQTTTCSWLSISLDG